MEVMMAVFDPNDWWSRRSWFAPDEARDRRRSEDVNREALHRWLAVVAFCLCFAGLGPVGHLPWVFAGLLVAAAFASAAVALANREHPLSGHLTAWDEAAWSLALGLGVAVWFGPVLTVN
jgi:hypothetical protein